MENVIIVLIILVAVAVGVAHAIKHFKGKSGCCGGGDCKCKDKKKQNK